MPTLHLHIDESGNLDFSPKGSLFYIFAAVWTYQPAVLAQSLTSLRFNLLKSGTTPVKDRFHAAEDSQVCRDHVVDTLLADRFWTSAAIVIEKRKVNPAIREPEGFYPKFLSILLRFIFRGNVDPRTSRVLLFTDTLPLPTRKSRGVVSEKLAATCRAELGDLPVGVHHHASSSNAWLQVADYCCWAVCRKWECGDSRTYQRLATRMVKSELDTLQRGTTFYY